MASSVITRIALTVTAGALIFAMHVSVYGGDVTAGRAKAQQCIACHGLDGVSRLPDAPHIAGDSAIYLAAQLRAYRSGERNHAQMSIIAKGLSDEDIADLAAWYSSIAFSVELPE
ncbi:cytochrome c553 [Natronocella acetinitrilica]|uniref:Cytochrome c553 n=1 Tax=Natronocella acetinitrilica TaxID=414046 RepID=A0AAE3G5H0_9GAMM|nr:cytochrome c [Natronocella acetinitrilica]MCP1676216.1 cytochrome c553 [Natronocella acetinitrilica]